MHILVVNDDGPPSPHSSPYVHSLVRELQDNGHVVSVCLPHTQRSWIGKAHMIGQTVKPLYYRPPPRNLPPAGLVDSDSHGTTHSRPSTKPAVEEWILVDGTPASCVQIGLYHFFKDKGPIDLVVSGPNYGRNSTAVFALSSGTLGGALEGAVCKRRSIALSYAFFSRNHDNEIIKKASRQSVRVIEALWKQWPVEGEGVDLYSVNIPLLEGLEEGKVLFAGILQNYWGEGSCFTEVEGSVDGGVEEEERIREGEGTPEGGETEGEGGGGCLVPHTHKHFKWSPRFTDVYKSVDEAEPGNDGWAVKEGHTSVTPLKANFFQAATDLHGQELQLDQFITLPIRQQPTTYLLVNYADDYVQPLILNAIEKLIPSSLYTLLNTPANWHPTTNPDISLKSLLPSDDKDSKVIQIMPYESLDFEYAAENPERTLINSYMIRKALIRKHYLGVTVDNWVTKNPSSVLKRNVKRAEGFEVDYAEFLDDAVVECWDLKESMEKNESLEEDQREWWILKPGMSDRGQGIRLFSSMDELQQIFDEWEVDQPDSDDEEASENEAEGVMASHLRHFIAQPYIHPPLLINNRKFHIRVYVLCIGSLKIYVYRDMLALFSSKEYSPPTFDTEELDRHLTNTCLQGQVAKEADSVKRFWELDLQRERLEGIWKQIKEVTGEVFEAAARGMMMHFRPEREGFEVYGLDFLVSAGGGEDEDKAFLLEVNAFPDFKQTGEGLTGVVGGFWEGVVGVALGGFLGEKVEGEGVEGMEFVRGVELGRGGFA
ncbi:tubulin-tyrosine ligase [Podospora fimiseda]|uniref:Tubulin-tyrosine ligase n=1 Tax=Podospora fimiseda TaxID=252190 RepID=A0AAN7BTU6_9PEZI|nr:tubulin-tyrosine ligase [Podospora fimiseda]